MNALAAARLDRQPRRRRRLRRRRRERLFHLSDHLRERTDVAPSEFAEEGHDARVVAVVEVLADVRIEVIVLEFRVCVEQNHERFGESPVVAVRERAIGRRSGEDALVRERDSRPVRARLFVMVVDELRFLRIHAARDGDRNHRFFGAQMRLIGEVVDEIHEESHRRPHVLARRLVDVLLLQRIDDGAAARENPFAEEMLVFEERFEGASTVVLRRAEFRDEARQKFVSRRIRFELRAESGRLRAETFDEVLADEDRLGWLDAELRGGGAVDARIGLVESGVVIGDDVRGRNEVAHRA